ERRDALRDTRLLPGRSRVLEGHVLRGRLLAPRRPPAAAGRGPLLPRP
ncbi:MAG: hypothetical protein AVDCRST_MAG78-942, partial [uncultured Rubrobacteraceae bacterium]